MHVVLCLAYGNLSHKGGLEFGVGFNLGFWGFFGILELGFADLGFLEWCLALWVGSALCYGMGWMG